MIFATKKPNSENLTQFFKNWSETLDSPFWIAFQFNYHTFENSFENYSFESHTRTQEKIFIHQLKFGKSEKCYEVEAWFSNKKKIKGQLEKKAFPHEPHNDLVHHQFKAISEFLMECGKREPQKSFTPQDEAQGKEWLRVTLELLKEALKTVKSGREQGGNEVLQGLIFCGHHPTRNKFLFRLRLFNIDLDIEEDSEHNLRCLVLNKKSNESFEGIEPSMTMVFNREKKDVLNFLIKLLPYISEACI